MRTFFLAIFLLLSATAAGPAFAQDANTANDQANAVENMVENTADTNSAETNQAADEGTNQAAQRDTDANENIVGDSGEALVKLFVLAVLLEFALALIFNWRPFIVLFDGRGVKTVVSFIAALIIVYFLRPNSVGELMADYDSPLAGTAADIALILEAMIIAGGSAGVYNLLVALGIRSPRTEQVVPRPKPDEAWVSIALREKTKTNGPVDVFITEQGKAAQYLGRLEAARKRRGFLGFFLRDPARLPPSGGIHSSPPWSTRSRPRARIRRAPPSTEAGAPTPSPREPWSTSNSICKGGFAKRVAPRDGFEPSANRLTAGCSTAELPGSSLSASGAYSSGFSAKARQGKRFFRR